MRCCRSARSRGYGKVVKEFEAVGAERGKGDKEGDEEGGDDNEVAV